jgi:hypothetical protein
MCIAAVIAAFALTAVYRQMERDQSEAVAALTGTPLNPFEEEYRRRSAQWKAEYAARKQKERLL